MTEFAFVARNIFIPEILVYIVADKTLKNMALIKIFEDQKGHRKKVLEK